MITINITLIVQIIHFLIAYQLISRLVLKPGLALVRQEQNEKKQALQRVAAEQAIAAQKQETKRQRWRLCQYYFSEHKPSPVSFVRTRINVARHVQPDLLNKQQISELAHTIVTALKPKATHD